MGPGGTGHTGGAPVHLHLQCDCGFFAVPLLQRKQLSFDFHESLPGVLLLPSSSLYAQGTHLLTPSPLGLPREVS